MARKPVKKKVVKRSGTGQHVNPAASTSCLALNNILHIFINVDMRGGDRYLSALLRDHKLSRDNLAERDHYLFVNRRRTMVKAIGKKGLYAEKYEAKEGIFELPDLINKVGKCFGMSFSYCDSTPVTHMDPLPLKFRHLGTIQARQWI